MSLAEKRAKIKASIWQAVAQSGVDVSVLSQGDMDRLVGAITETLLKEVDELLGESAGSPAFASEAGDDEVEKVLWEGRPFLSISIQYQITDERLRIIEGALVKERRDIELVRIKDIDHKQNLTERAFNIGDVFVHSSDPNDPEIVLYNVSDPAEVHEILRRAVLKARQKYKMSFREEM